MHDKIDESAEFEKWRGEQIASLQRMGYPGAAKAFRNHGSLHWAGWQARAALAATPAAPVAQEPVAWPDEIHQKAFEEGQPAENGDGYSFTAEEFDLFVERLLSRAAPPAAEQPDTVAVPRKVLRELTDTAITEWHDPSVNEAAQDRNECLCCGVEDGHNADCAVAIALRLLAGGAE